MKTLDVIVPNPSGLHARPAKVFVKTAKKFKAKIWVQHGEKEVNAKSVISVLTLGVEEGSQIRLSADGPDADEALQTLKTAIEAGLGDNLAEKPAEKSSPTPNGAPAISPKPVLERVGPDKVVRGIPASGGIAIGPLHHLKRADINIEAASGDPASEQKRLTAAIAHASRELEAVHQQVTHRLGAEEAAIFEAHLEILNDPDLRETAQNHLQQGQSAGQAWQTAFEAQAKTLAKLNDDTLAARAIDIRDVGNRVLRALSGQSHSQHNLPNHPVILIAPDLTPSDTVTLDLEKVLGFCTATGGANGHTAILARALGLPAVVGAGDGVLSQQADTAILNGDIGTLDLNPSAEALATAERLQLAQQSRHQAELQAAHDPALTTDGHLVEVVANIGNLTEARQALQFGAEGVGLLRTEFLFLDREQAPTEDEQFQVYRDIALALKGQPVIIRTLDVGGDKPLPYLSLPSEENPFLGQRGIRLCLARPELLRTQVRAIFRAAEYGSLRIMFPMISTLADWTAARKLVSEVQAELKAKPIEVGIMVEVPSAALLARTLASEVDFFSVGTNDLTQYTLAMDRTNPNLSEQADGLNPAILHLIDLTVRAAHTAGKWVGVCGELAADSQAVPILLGLGVDELSASVPALPGLKAQIRTLTLSKMQVMAAQALACASPTEVRHLVDSLIDT